MASEVVISSTTDSQEMVNQAAGNKLVEEPEVIEEDAAPPEEQQKTSEKQPEKPPEEKEVPRAVSKKIDKLTREKSELQARLDALEQKVQQQQTPNPAEARRVEEEIIEVPETFPSKVDWLAMNAEKTEEDYIDARADWKFDLRQAQQQEADAKAQREATERQVLDNYNEKLNDFKSEHDDFDEIVGNPTIKIPQSVQVAILEMNIPEVAYYIGQHPDEAKKMMAMTPAVAAAYVGKLAARLEPEEREDQEEVLTRKTNPDRAPVRSGASRAPAPIKPLTGHSTRSSVPIDELPYGEYRKIRDRQEKERFRR
jgi:hypothetical protein